MDKLPSCPQLPEVVLNCVFSYIEDPIDLLNAMRTCNQWERVLNPRKSAILLSNCVPFISQYVDLSRDLLSCRTLCKDVKGSIDKMLDYTNNVQQYTWSIPEEYSKHYNHYKFNAKNVSDYMSKYSSHSGNPFIGRWIAIYVTEYPTLGHLDQDRFTKIYNAFEEMLTRFGKELTGITFCYSSQPVTFATFNQFQSLLSLVPNLQCLEVRVFGELWSHQDEHVTLLTRTLPPLKNLTCLQLRFVGRTTLGCAYVTAYGPQLIKLISTGEVIDCIPLEMLNGSLANLKIAQIFSWGSVLSQVNWKLESLQVSVRNSYEFVDVLNNFGNTLVYLDVGSILISPEFEREPRWPTIQLDKLKLLQTQFCNTKSVWFCKVIQTKFTSLIVLKLTIRWGDIIGNGGRVGWKRLREMDIEGRREFMRSSVLADLNDDWFELMPQLEKIQFLVVGTFGRRVCIVVHRQ